MLLPELGTCCFCGRGFTTDNAWQLGPESAFGRSILEDGQRAHVACFRAEWNRRRVETFGAQYARRILALRWAWRRAVDEANAVILCHDARPTEEQRRELRMIADELREMLDHAEEEAKP